VLAVLDWPGEKTMNKSRFGVMGAVVRTYEYLGRAIRWSSRAVTTPAPHQCMGDETTLGRRFI